MAGLTNVDGDCPPVMTELGSEDKAQGLPIGIRLPDIVPETLSSSCPTSLGFPALYSRADDSLPPSDSEEDEDLSASDEAVVEEEEEGDGSSVSSAAAPSASDQDLLRPITGPCLLPSHQEQPQSSTAALASEPEASAQSQSSPGAVGKAGAAEEDDHGNDTFEEAAGWVVLATMISYAILFLFGYLRDFLRWTGIEKVVAAKDLARHADFVPLLSDFENFYIVNVVRRTFDCWKRPICSVPGPTTDVMERETKDGGFTYQLTGRTTHVLNLSSYNYLGFAQSSGPCARAAKAAIHESGLACASARAELGAQALEEELEETVARFTGCEAALCFSMGYATNSLNIPALAGKGCLLLSDELNHASLITGCKLSGSTKRIFKHNDMEDLERKLRDAIVVGQPRSRRPWRKIIVVVEGVYSMEGTIVKLPQVIALCKRYKAYLYLDEAHSTGAMGPNGRGVVDYWGCDPRDVDVMMGTFTKSFGSVGGYIAGSARLIRHLRAHSHASAYAAPLSAPAIVQAMTAMRIIAGEDGSGDGQARIASLRRNSRYFRRCLKARGFITYGHDDSPVIPLLLYSFTAVSAFSREMLEKYGMATVTVAFPATPIYLGRARICVSSAHTKAMIDQAVAAIDELGDEYGLKFSPHAKARQAANELVVY